MQIILQCPADLIRFTNDIVKIHSLKAALRETIKNLTGYIAAKDPQYKMDVK